MYSEHSPVPEKEKTPVLDEEETPVPGEFYLGIDIDIIGPERKEHGVIHCIKTIKITPNNYVSVIGDTFDASKKSYEECARAYGCDVCKKETSLDNPIYTNPTYQGADICSECVKKAFGSGKLFPTFGKKTYLLSDLVNVIQS